MIIHVVQPGETIYSIAAQYNVSPQKIIIDNELENPNVLVPGQTLVILVPETVHVGRYSKKIQHHHRKFASIKSIYRFF